MRGATFQRPVKVEFFAARWVSTPTPAECATSGNLGCPLKEMAVPSSVAPHEPCPTTVCHRRITRSLDRAKIRCMPPSRYDGTGVREVNGG